MTDERFDAVPDGSKLLICGRVATSEGKPAN